MRKSWLAFYSLMLTSCDSGSSTTPNATTNTTSSNTATTSDTTSGGTSTTNSSSTSTGTGTGTSTSTSTTSSSQTASASSSASTASSAGGASNTSSSTGSGGGGTPSSDRCDTAIFCDDFESYAAGQAPGGVWTSQTNSGAVSIDASRKVSGAQSARFTTEAGDGSKTAYLRLEDSSVFPVPDNAFYGRMLFWLESAPSEAVHWTFLQGGGTVPGQTYRALYRYGGQHPVSGGNQLMANYETPDSYSGNGPASDCWQHAQGEVVPVGRWSCVEWQFDGSANEMRLWLDGVAIESLTVTGSGEGCVSSDVDNMWTAPTFGYLEIGWESYQPDEARTLFIDDLVIDDEPIGCPTLP